MSFELFAIIAIGLLAIGLLAVNVSIYRLWKATQIARDEHEIIHQILTGSDLDDAHKKAC